MKSILLFLLLIIFACASQQDKSEDEKVVTLDKPLEWQGAWTAQWKTSPESYPSMEDMEFYMNGEFTFISDSLTITANGYPSCIFNIDTISHTQSWYVSNDTLFLFNGSNTLGMHYRIASKSENQVNLQLMDDIFITLTK